MHCCLLFEQCWHQTATATWFRESLRPFKHVNCWEAKEQKSNTQSVFGLFMHLLTADWHQPFTELCRALASLLKLRLRFCGVKVMSVCLLPPQYWDTEYDAQLLWIFVLMDLIKLKKGCAHVVVIGSKAIVLHTAHWVYALCISC